MPLQAENKQKAGCLGGSKKSSRGEVRGDVSSISGKAAEKRQNMKLKRYIEKINKQENCYEQVMTDGHTLSHPDCANIVRTVVLLSQVLFAVILLEITTVRVQYVGLKTRFVFTMLWKEK